MPWQIITNLEFPSVEILEFLENLEFLGLIFCFLAQDFS